MSQLPRHWGNTTQYYTPNVQAKMSGMAMASMVLGIVGVVLGIFVVGLLLSLVGLILGIIALIQINRDPARLGGKGFALTGIVLGIVGPVVIIPVLAIMVLPAILMPSMGRARELANRSTCSANMTGILKACIVYANENNDVFPTAGNPYAANTYSLGMGVAAPGGTRTLDDAAMAVHATSGARGNPTSCMWIPVLRNMVAPKSLLCKSDLTVTGPSPMQNTAGQYLLTPETDKQISYSIAYPWAATNAVGGWWRNNCDSSLPLMSDMAPGNATMLCTSTGARPKDYNSQNHGGDGQNVGFADAHSEWARRPDVGQKGEMIFCTGEAGKTQTPFRGGGMILWAWTPSSAPYDTVMVPVRDARTGSIR